MDSAVQLYDELESSYLPDGLEGDSSVHQYIATIEFQLRFVTMCSAAAVQSLDPGKVKLSRSPGFGSFQAFLKSTGPFLRGSAQRDAIGSTSDLIDAVLGEVRAGNGKDPQFGTLEKLRNHLFHGNPLPSGDAGRKVAQRVKNTMSAMSILIREYLSGAVASVAPGEESLKRLELHWDNARMKLWPFICVDDDGRLCVFSTFGSTVPAYLRSSPDEVRIDGRGEELTLALARSMQHATLGTMFADFVNDLRADLEGFREQDHPVHHYEEDAEVTVYWNLATGVGSGADERTDMFRLGNGDQRQWKNRESDDWVPYPDFLRHIVNWNVVARRVRQNLKRVESELNEAEKKALGWAKRSFASIEPRVRVSDLQTTGNEPTILFDQLKQDIDKRLSTRGPSTRIYFVSGEAGIGKTRLMVNAALRRAYEIEEEDKSTPSEARRPLYFYVRSTGHATASLDTVIGAAATETQNLKLQNIKALCRNGLVALLVDGFDEFLGSAGYDNALGALEPWIKAMDGRGVIVVSARSSYYLNQYSSSLRKEQQRQDLMVEHRVAAVQRWDSDQVESFLIQHGVDLLKERALEKNDRNLLGLPFFARVFAESLNSVEGYGNSLPDLLLRKYIERESPKLISSGDQGAPLLSPDELHVTFETLARIMAEQGVREVVLDDLEYAVQTALNETDLTVRPGLTRRLSVLCNLDVSEQSGVPKKFAFQHELFYDIFLADSILRDLYADNFSDVIELLGRSQLRIATISRLVRQQADRVELMLRSNIKNISELHAVRQKAFAANLGLLWETLIHQTGRVESVELSEMVFGHLDLTGVAAVNVKFINCRFDLLTLPAVESKNVRFVNCVIDSLRVANEDLPLRGVTEFEDVRVQQLIRRVSLVEKPEEVQRALRELGAPLPVVDEPETESEFVKAVEYFLERFSIRTDIVVVYADGLMPADDNPPWQLEYGGEAWAAFIRLLKESGAGKLVSIDAGGPAVCRVKVNAIQGLRNRGSLSLSSSIEFWEMVKKHRVAIE
ncbi:hypothetical protein [Umezawaea tangerina]|uniref:NACHT domain-containing protein n=1 Tax=Umezawaea tangerina TaxID=84725 RepID=A0A2T0SE71_9PSEU|nr:hypothetical protein [Umezawaea tangerina]PRY31700.1 hypothetical protein CLV43_122107 [Umezawaea tangerina]